MNLKFLNIIFFLVTGLFCQLPLFEKENLARQYYDSKFYDDAIVVYEEILNEKINILGSNNINLKNELIILSELYYLINDLERSKNYLYEFINIQSKYILDSQNNYLEPLYILKEIYSQEKNFNNVFSVDSLINILENNTNMLSNDSLFVLPILVNNQQTNNKQDTEYTLNDTAIDLINQGFVYMDNELYSESAKLFIEALTLKASITDFDYFIKLNFGDEKQQNELYKSFVYINKEDSTRGANFYLGVMDYQNEDYASAIFLFSEYQKYNPNDFNSIIGLGDIYFNQKLWTDALFYYYRAIKQNPNNLHANLQVAKTLFNLNEYNDAVYILNSIKNIYFNNYDIYYNLSLCYFALNQFDLSIERINQAILLNSESADAYFRLGLCYNSKKIYKQSLEAFKKCVKINPYNGTAHFELAKIYQLILNDELAIKHYNIAKKTIDHPQLNYNIGILYYQNNQYLEAINPLKKYLINNMNDWETLAVLGKIFFETSRFPEASDIYLRLIDEFPDIEEYYYQLAESYLKINDYMNAIQNYQKALTFDEENYDILLKLGTILNIQNNFNKAETYLIDALHCGTPNKQIFVQLGMSYGGQNKFLQSLQAFKGGLSYSLNDPIINYQIGIIYKELEIYDLAIDSFNQYLINNDNDYIAYYLIGDCYSNLNVYDIALEYYNKSYKLNNSHTKSLYSIGSCYLKLDNNKQAAKIFKSIVKSNPNHVQSRLELVNLYVALNKSREARKECEIIFMLDRELYNSISYCSK